MTAHTNYIPRLAAAAAVSAVVQYAARTYPAMIHFRSAEIVTPIFLGLLEMDFAHRLASGPLRVRGEKLQDDDMPWKVLGSHLLVGAAMTTAVWGVRYFNAYYGTVPTILASAALNLCVDLVLRNLADPSGGANRYFSWQGRSSSGGTEIRAQVTNHSKS